MPRLRPWLAPLLLLAARPVMGQVVDRIAPRSSRMELTAGKADSLQVDYLDRRGNSIPSDKVRPVFRSADTSIATITSAGTVMGRKAGTTRIRVQVGSKYGWVLLAVSDVPPPAPVAPTIPTGFLRVPLAEIHLVPGETADIQASFRRSDNLPAPDLIITYTSSNKGIAVVDSLTGRVTAMTQGSTAVIAVAPGTPAIGVNIVVGDPTLKLSADSLFIVEGTPDTLSLLVMSQRDRPYHGRATWESSNTNVAKVDSLGVLRGITRGVASITATTPYFTGQAFVQVYPPAIARSTLPPDTSIILPLGTTTDLVIRGFSTDNQPLYVIPSTWTVSDSNVAYYDLLNGQIVARAAGTTTLTAQPRIHSMNRPRIWRIVVFSGTLVPEVERIGLKLGMKQTVSGQLLDTAGVRVNRPVTLRWDDPGNPGVQISPSGAISVLNAGGYSLTGRASWGAAVTVKVFGLPDLMFSEVDGNKGSILQGMSMTAVPRVPQPVMRGTAINMQPAVSPDRTMMVFASNRKNKDYDLWMADPDGSNERVLLTAPGMDQSPIWFPRGNRIAFSAIRPGKGPQIYSIRSDGTDLRRVSDSTGSAAYPAIAPDGSRIVYESLRSQQYDIFSVRLAGDTVVPGTREQPVLASKDNERSPQFFPSGDLAYIKEEAGGKRNRILMRVIAGSQVSQALTTPDLLVKDFAISPDGTYVVFSAPPPGERSSSSKYRLYLLDLRQPGTATPIVLYAPASGGVGTPSFVP